MTPWSAWTNSNVPALSDGFGQIRRTAPWLELFSDRYGAGPREKSRRRLDPVPPRAVACGSPGNDLRGRVGLSTESKAWPASSATDASAWGEWPRARVRAVRFLRLAASAGRPGKAA